MTTFEQLPQLVSQLVAEVKELRDALQQREPATIRENPITRQELMKRLGVTEPTVIRWEKKGAIPCFRIGSAVRYDFAKVLTALETKKKRN